jgi:hypothetical protein
VATTGASVAPTGASVATGVALGAQAAKTSANKITTYNNFFISSISLFE